MLAYYIATDWAHLIEMEADGVTPKLKKYDVIVANVAIDRAKLQEVCKPGAYLLASINATMIPSYGVGNAVLESLRLAMQPYYLRDLSGNPSRSSEEGDFYINWKNRQGALVLADWLAAHWPRVTGRHGIYIDDLTEEIPPHKARDIEDVTALPHYPVWRQHFVTHLYSRFPVVVGNTGGFIDPKLNGICIETGHIPNPLIRLAKYVVASNNCRAPRVQIDFAGPFGKVLFADLLFGISDVVRNDIP